MEMFHKLSRAAMAVAMLASLAIPALAADALRTGSFTGASGHDTSGSVQIVQEGGKTLIRLGKDFMQDGTAPDVTIGLGHDGYDAATNLGKLRSFVGAQDYELPAGIDVSKYNEVYIWCKKFAVSLGVAPIN